MQIYSQFTRFPSVVATVHWEHEFREEIHTFPQHSSRVSAAQSLSPVTLKYMLLLVLIH